MPNKKNGVRKQAKPITMPKISAKERKIRQKVGDTLLLSLIEWYSLKRTDNNNIDDVVFAGLVDACLLQYGAAIAVDLNLKKDAFLHIAGMLYDEAYTKAPKFG
jgi:hypothetical protein